MGDKNPPPSNARRSEGEGVGGESRGGTRDKVGPPSPLGGRGTPEEQAWAIVPQIPAARAHGAQRGHRGGPLITQERDPPVRQGPGRGRGPPSPAVRTNRARAGGVRGRTARAQGARADTGRRGGPPLNGSMRSQRMACPGGRRGTPGARRKRRGHPPSIVRSQRTECRGGGGPQTPRSRQGDPPSSVRPQRTV